MKKIFLISAIVFFSISCNTKTITMIDKTVVTDFELDRYLGTWYEIARYDHSFERGLVGVTANYSLRKDGKIKVLNSGYKGSLSGPRSESIGKAKIPNPNIPSKLKVSFFLFFYADYFILDLDPDYQWALIGSKGDNFLWILSRKPQISPELYQQLTNKLEKRGYDTSKLIKVEQKS